VAGADRPSRAWPETSVRRCSPSQSSPG
jgi:hypothetical protein